jgi:hypothetical protein
MNCSFDKTWRASRIAGGKWLIRSIPQAALVLVAVSTNAAENAYSPSACTGTVVPVSGVVTSRPANPANLSEAAGCAQAATLGGGVQPDPLLPEPVCLKVDVSGTVKATGFSMLTTVPVVSAAGFAATPICFFLPPNGPGDQTRGCSLSVGGSMVPVPATSAGLQGFTSQAALTGSVQGNKYTGTVYTKDTGYVTSDGFIGQILLVAGGTGSFEGATGRVGIAGQEVGGYANYTGHLCIPKLR